MNNIIKCGLIVVTVLFGSLHAMEGRAKNTVEHYLKSILSNSELEICSKTLKVDNSSGYYVVKNARFKSFFTGTSGIPDVRGYIGMIKDRISNYVNDDQTLDLMKQLNLVKNADDFQNDRKNIAGHYKIHLMPGSKAQCTEIIRTILSDKDIKANIEKFKLISSVISFDGFWKNPIEYLKTQSDGDKLGVSPIMVLYCARGKDKAQKILDVLYGFFGNQPGIGVVPRFSEKVTDLIFYTQDNSNEKVEKADIERNAKGKLIYSIANIKKLSPEVYSTLFPHPIFNESKTLYNEHFVSEKEKADYYLSLPSLKEKGTKKEEEMKKKKSKKKKGNEK